VSISEIQTPSQMFSGKDLQDYGCKSCKIMATSQLHENICDPCLAITVVSHIPFDYHKIDSRG